MKKIFTIQLLILLSGSAYAQKNLQPGYIITSDGKKITGHINYKEWDKNPVSVEFSADETDKLQTYGLNDISYFEITGIEAYERHTCTISLHKVNLNELSFGPDSSSRTETVFLKVLEKGKIVLYRYRDDLKLRFFIKGGDESEPRELRNSLYYDAEKSTTLAEPREYRDQLLSEAERYADLSKVKKKIFESNYTDGDLSKVARLINTGGTTDKSGQRSDLRKVWLYAGAGAHFGSFSLEGDRRPYPANGYSFSEAASPVFFAGLNLYLNPKTAKLLLKSDLSFFLNSHKATAPGVTGQFAYQYTYDLSVKYSSLAMFLGLTYNYISLPKLEAYISFGPGGQFISVSELKEHETRVSIVTPTDRSERDINEITLQKFFITYSFRAGLLLKRKIDISVNATGLNGRLTSYLNFRDKGFYAQLRVGYMFGSEKGR